MSNHNPSNSDGRGVFEGVIWEIYQCAPETPDTPAKSPRLRPQAKRLAKAILRVLGKNKPREGRLYHFPHRQYINE